jgi:hypothetical protein
VVFRKMDGTGDHHFKQTKTDLEKQILYAFSHMWNLVEGDCLGWRIGPGVEGTREGNGKG